MSNEIDNIQVEYINQVDNILLEYDTTITNIELAVGGFSQNVVSVNGLFGNVRLTASTTLGLVSPSAGIYSYSVAHDLGYNHVLTSLYDTNDNLVFGEVKILVSASVTINSLVILTDYKVVIQR